MRSTTELAFPFGFQAVGDVKELEVIATAVRSDPNLATIEQRIPVKQGQPHTHGLDA